MGTSDGQPIKAIEPSADVFVCHCVSLCVHTMTHFFCRLMASTFALAYTCEQVN